MREPWINSRRRWLIDFARTSDLGMDEITHIYNEKFNEKRSVSSVTFQLWGLRASPMYTKEQVDWLIEHKDMMPKEMTLEFNGKFHAMRTVRSITMKMHYLRKGEHNKYSDQGLVHEERRRKNIGD